MKSPDALTYGSLPLLIREGWKVGNVIDGPLRFVGLRTMTAFRLQRVVPEQWKNKNRKQYLFFSSLFFLFDYSFRLAFGIRRNIFYPRNKTSLLGISFANELVRRFSDCFFFFEYSPGSSGAFALGRACLEIVFRWHFRVPYFFFADWLLPIISARNRQLIWNGWIGWSTTIGIHLKWMNGSSLTIVVPFFWVALVS